MTLEELDAIQERVDAATEGPWVSRSWDDEMFMGVWGVRSRDRVLLAVCNCHASPAPTDADTEFIAHSRTDIPALLAEVRRLREALAAAPPLVGVWNIGGHRTISEEALSAFVDSYSEWA